MIQYFFHAAIIKVHSLKRESISHKGEPLIANLQNKYFDR